MNHCEYCNAPMLSITKVCPNCQREQPPYPPVLPGGGSKSYTGWALYLIGFAALFGALGVAMLFQGPYSTASAWIFGSPDNAFTGNQQTYLLPNSDGSGGFYPGWGYLIFFGGIAVILVFWAVISYNRGQSIDKANRAILRSLEHNANGNGQ